MKKFLITLVILVVVLIGAGSVYVYFNKDKIVQKTIEKGFASVEGLMVENLPVSVSKDSAQALVNEAMAKVKSGELKAEQLQGVFMSFQENWKDKQLDSLEVKELVTKLQKVLVKARAENP